MAIALAILLLAGIAPAARGEATPPTSSRRTPGKAGMTAGCSIWISSSWA